MSRMLATNSHRKSVCAALFVPIVAVAAALTAPPAAAQITVKQLIGNAVTDIGPQYKDVEQAITYFRYGRLSQAQESLKAAKKKNPNLAPGNVMFAQLLFLANQLPAAHNALEQAVMDDPNDPEAYIILAELALRGTRITEADMLYTHGGALVDKYTRNAKRKRNMAIRVASGLATVAEGRKQWSDAERHLRVALKESPENLAMHERLARSLFMQDKAQDAYKVFQDQYQLDNKQVLRPEISMARLYEQDGKRDNAKQLMGFAVERDANTLATRLAVAQWAIEAGELTMAKTNAAAALKLDSKSMPAQLLVGLVARYEGRHDDAVKAFEAAHLADPLNGMALNHLALSLIELNDENQRSRALAYARLNSRANSDASQMAAREAAMTLGWIQFKLNNEVEAARTVQAALKAGSVNLDSAYYAAQILHDRGRPAAARQVLEAALKNKTNFPARKAAENLFAKIPASATDKPVEDGAGGSE